MLLEGAKNERGLPSGTTLSSGHCIWQADCRRETIMFIKLFSLFCRLVDWCCLRGISSQELSKGKNGLSIKDLSKQKRYMCSFGAAYNQ
jgi:hypothetical protein